MTAVDGAVDKIRSLVRLDAQEDLAEALKAYLEAALEEGVTWDGITLSIVEKGAVKL